MKCNKLFLHDSDLGNFIHLMHCHNSLASLAIPFLSFISSFFQSFPSLARKATTTTAITISTASTTTSTMAKDGKKNNNNDNDKDKTRDEDEQRRRQAIRDERERRRAQAQLAHIQRTVDAPNLRGLFQENHRRANDPAEDVNLASLFEAPVPSTTASQRAPPVHPSSAAALEAAAAIPLPGNDDDLDSDALLAGSDNDEADQEAPPYEEDEDGMDVNDLEENDPTLPNNTISVGEILQEGEVEVGPSRAWVSSSLKDGTQPKAVREIGAAMTGKDERRRRRKNVPEKPASMLPTQTQRRLKLHPRSRRQIRLPQEVAAALRCQPPPQGGRRRHRLRECGKSRPRKRRSRGQVGLAFPR